MIRALEKWMGRWGRRRGSRAGVTLNAPCSRYGLVAAAYRVQRPLSETEKVAEADVNRSDIRS